MDNKKNNEIATPKPMHVINPTFFVTLKDDEISAVRNNIYSIIEMPNIEVLEKIDSLQKNMPNEL